MVVPRPKAPEARRKKQKFDRDEQDVQDKIKIIFRVQPEFCILFILSILVN
jgi:hypothetical protein